MSSTFTVSRDQIIKLALIKLNVLEIGDNPDAETINHMSMSLNLLIKQMATDGLKIWKNTELIVPVTANQTTYILGGPTSVPMYDSFDTGFTTPIVDKPLKLIQAWYRNNEATPPIDVPLQLLSKQEYNTMGSKYSTGVPNSIFYDIKQNNGIVYAYLTPNTFVATNYYLHLVMQMPMNDINKAQDIPDFPNEWMNCLVWNLADQVAMDYTVPANHRAEIMSRAKAYKDQMTDWDVESTSTFFQPDLRMKNYHFGNTV